ncbi:MAG: hypothetical protein R2865_01510 [Deinococcales bacterium]
MPPLRCGDLNWGIDAANSADLSDVTSFISDIDLDFLAGFLSFRR